MVNPNPPSKGQEFTELTGLSNDEVAKKIEQDGFNELPRGERRYLYRIVAEIVKEPMVFLVMGCGAVYLVLGDPSEASFLLTFLALIVGIAVYQEQKSERALEALRNLSSPRALVIRNGKQQRIPGREVVRGDLLILSEGARIPADALILSSMNLSTDESMLSGESVPIAKFPSENVFAGTMVVRGSALAKSIRTGRETELGKISRTLKKMTSETTQLQRETKSLVKIIALVAGVLCTVLTLVYALNYHNWLGGLLAGLTLAMAILPNELPAVLTIFLALGAWRLSQNRVLTRKSSAIEALGAATVLCVDKTGTLTYNRMSLKLLCSADAYFRVGSSDILPECFHELIEYGILAGEKNPTEPMEQALLDAGGKLLVGTEHLHYDWNLVKQYPLSADLLALSHVWRTIDGKIFPVAAKGAPEAVIDLCHLEKEDSARIRKHVNEMAKEGLRVLAVAKAELSKLSLPAIQHDFDFKFLGLLGFEDPIRKEVPAAVAECHRAGVRVIMITGDHPDTARSVAREIGLPNPNCVLTGEEMKQISRRELSDAIARTHVYARMSPAQKLLLVSLMKEKGDTVAMTGDGINDAPALKAAHIGISMGARGTDVARESSSIVLLDDDFGSIVYSVKMGRRIFDNLQRAMSYLVAVHIPITGLSTIPVLLKLPLILLPIHVAFLHLIIEPACSVVFEADSENSDLMLRPPRRISERLFSGSTLVRAVWQGISVLTVLIVIYLLALYRGSSEEATRTMSFTTLIIANLGLIQSNRANSKSMNSVFLSGLILSVALIAFIVAIPALRGLFRFSTLTIGDITVCVFAGLLGSLCLKLVGLAHSYRRQAKPLGT